VRSSSSSPIPPPPPPPPPYVGFLDRAVHVEKAISDLYLLFNVFNREIDAPEVVLKVVQAYTFVCICVCILYIYSPSLFLSASLFLFSLSLNTDTHIHKQIYIYTHTYVYIYKNPPSPQTSTSPYPPSSASPSIPCLPYFTYVTTTSRPEIASDSSSARSGGISSSPRPWKSNKYVHSVNMFVSDMHTHLHTRSGRPRSII